ncbi:putative leader peptide [Streptomyces sp. HUAS MG47]|uniref:putative leader peptide n=1 Tax=Streptomyces solicamelliae TaxID=3231716 RepID=UPI003877BE72
MSADSECETGTQATLTWLECAGSLVAVTNSEHLAARLHVDLRRQAGAICAVGRCTR